VKHPKLFVEPSGQFSPEGEEMLNLFYEGECLAANILENEIEPIYYQFILEHSKDEPEEYMW
jgi:hypothetical protein